jgi:chromosomal replication initiator protein
MAIDSLSQATEQTQLPRRPTVRRVLYETARHYNVSLAELLIRSRKPRAVHRRQLAAYVARTTTGRSLKLIADRLGWKDHTSTLHGVRSVKALLDAGDAATVAAVDAIAAQVEGGANNG